MPTSDIKKVCPFTPQLTSGYKSVKCIGEECQMWNEKKKDCGLKK